MKITYTLGIIVVYAFVVSCSSMKTLEVNTQTLSDEQLLRVSYNSEIAGEERDYFLYLPKGYEEDSEKEWPVLMFLHGNGERGNGKDELDFSMVHGPLMEAWVQKRDLPFIIINPQLHMFGLDTMGIDYLTYRDPNNIPRRLDVGVPDRDTDFPTDGGMNAEVPVSEFSEELPLSEFGWDRVQNDLIGMIDYVTENYQVDSKRIYLSGLSYGGFGTWYMASHYANRFAAVIPVVGWGHPSLMPSIADAQLPVWAFAGGRDYVIEKKYFYKGLNQLEELGHTNVIFTVHEDMGHDAWKRVYAGEDVYNWLLGHSID
ncbi:MAG: alpha/beta hydrolase [Balneola sp.]|nr:MAG: alpha/beta hydrolase [Balneola sp.]